MRRIKGRLACGVLLCAALFSGCAEEEQPMQITESDVIRESLVVEGLEGEYELLFLTDTHMVLNSEEDSEQIKENAAVRKPQFADENGWFSAEQFPAWMEYAKAQQVDGVLLGGDMIDFPSDTAVTYLKENVDTLDMPYLYTMGNHDWTYPWEYMTETARTEYVPLLEPMMQGDAELHRMDIGELTCVAMDNSMDVISWETLEKFEEIMAEGRPMIVLVHVPFATDSVLTKAKEVWSSPVVIGAENFGGIYPGEELNAFLNLITREDSPVVAVLAGHVHFYDKDYINGEKPVLQLVGDAGFRRRGMLLRISGEAP